MRAPHLHPFLQVLCSTLQAFLLALVLARFLHKL